MNGKVWVDNVGWVDELEVEADKLLIEWAKENGYVNGSGVNLRAMGIMPRRREVKIAKRFETSLEGRIEWIKRRRDSVE